MDGAGSKAARRGALEAWELCRGLAQSENILAEFDQTLATVGLVGERRIAKLIYLAVTSRLLDHPVSVAVKGPLLRRQVVHRRVGLEVLPDRGLLRAHRDERPKPRLTSELFRTSFAAIAVAVLASAMVGRPLPASAQATAAPAIDNDDIGGVVTGPNGPEAGVWVIAESVELPTKFAKMVVTDDQGRYVIPSGELQRLGARLRPRGFTQNAGEARPAS